VIAVVVVVYLLTQDDTSTPDPVETLLLPLFGVAQFARTRIASVFADEAAPGDEIGE
jgi:hypothetical protein